MLARLLDFLKTNGITAMLTSLITFQHLNKEGYMAISSLIDTWILLAEVELNGECNRSLNLLKSRGMAHSNQIRELILTNNGVELMDVYMGPEGVLTGSARLQQEDHDRADHEIHQAEIQAIKAEIDGRRKAFEISTTEGRTILEAQEARMKLSIMQIGQREKFRKVSRENIAVARTDESAIAESTKEAARVSDIRKKGAIK